MYSLLMNINDTVKITERTLDGRTFKVVVRWESLGGNLYVKVFDTWKEAQEFADRKEAYYGTQWVDVEERD